MENILMQLCEHDYQWNVVIGNQSCGDGVAKNNTKRMNCLHDTCGENVSYDAWVRNDFTNWLPFCSYGKGHKGPCSHLV